MTASALAPPIEEPSAAGVSATSAFRSGMRWRSAGSDFHNRLPSRACSSVKENLIEGEDTPLARTFGIGKRDRGRVELGGIRAVPVTRHAVAGRAGLSEHHIGGGEVRGLVWRERHRVGTQQIGCEPAREQRHLFGRPLARDHRLEIRGSLDQGLPLWLRRQTVKPRRNRSGELVHLGIFSRALDPAIGDRSAIIDGHIVEQPPCGLYVAGCGHSRSRDKQRGERDGKLQEDKFETLHFILSLSRCDGA